MNCPSHTQKIDMSVDMSSLYRLHRVTHKAMLKSESFLVMIRWWFSNAKGRHWWQFYCDANLAMDAVAQWWPNHSSVPHDLPPYVLPARLFLGQDDLSVSPAKLVSLYRNHSLCELGSSNGVTLVHKGNKTRIQVQAPADLTLANARAYMPLGSRWDGNVRPASPSLPSFVCPRPLILFSEIRSHSRHALPFTGPATNHTLPYPWIGLLRSARGHHWRQTGVGAASFLVW